MSARISIWLAVLLAASVAANALASEADIGGVKFTLPPIEGYCELRGNDPSEAKLLDVAREVRAGKSLVLAMYGECKELERWKTGEQPYLDNHIVITSLLKYRDKIIPDDPDKWAAQVCELSKDKSFTQSKGITEDVEKRIANLSSSRPGIRASAISPWSQNFRLKVATKKTRLALEARCCSKAK